MRKDRHTVNCIHTAELTVPSTTMSCMESFDAFVSVKSKLIDPGTLNGGPNVSGGHVTGNCRHALVYGFSPAFIEVGFEHGRRLLMARITAVASWYVLRRFSMCKTITDLLPS